MRTTIIPAQVTTVEDKIVGSLNITQILILMFPVLFTAIIYILLPQAMKLTPYKLILIFLAVVICILLVIRIKDKIIAEWLGVLIRYRLRPKYWLFNKNNLTNRSVDIPELPVETAVAKKSVTKHIKVKPPELTISDLIKLEHLIESGKVAVRYQFEKK